MFYHCTIFKIAGRSPPAERIYAHGHVIMRELQATFLLPRLGKPALMSI